MMNHQTFIAQTENKLNLTMPFLSKELITSRAEEEWVKFQRKQTPKQSNNIKKEGKPPVKKPQRRVSTFREKLNTLSSDFAHCETPQPNTDALFDTVYNLRPKTRPKAKTNDVYNFIDAESDVIPSTLPPLMSNVTPTKKKHVRTTRKPQSAKTASKNQNKNRVRFVDDVNEKENRFVPIEISTEPPKTQKTSKKVIDEAVLSPKMDEIIPETQFYVDKSEERLKSPDLSNNLSDKQVGVVAGSEDDQEREKYLKPLTFAIEKLTEKLKMPNMNMGGRNNNIYWQITITNQTPERKRKTSVEENVVSEVFVEKSDFSQVLVERNDFSQVLVARNDFSEVLVEQNDFSQVLVEQNDFSSDFPQVLDEQNDFSEVLAEENRFFDDKTGKGEICGEIFVSERELEDPFREIGEKLEKLDRRSAKIGEIMRRVGIKTDQICEEIDSWLSGLSAERLDGDRRGGVKTKAKIKVIERKDEDHSHEWDFFDDVMENRTLFALPENHGVQDFLEDDDVFI